MADFVIVTDTPANLPCDYAKKNNVEVLPFPYYIDGKPGNVTKSAMFNAGIFYEAMRKGVRVTTSQINPEVYANCFEGFLKNGIDILYVGLSSGVSGSCASAQAAMIRLKEEYPERNIRIVDSLGASLGEGLLAVTAVDMKNQGKTLDEIADFLLEQRHSMIQIFVVDDLAYLKRTGRITGAVALVGNILQIKPLLIGNEKGQIVNYGKARGRKRSIELLAQRYDERVKDAGNQMIGISHADCQDDVDYLIELINRNNPPKSIMTVLHEPVTGSHVGPGMLSLYFLGGENARSL